jgi:hypothetical protein
MRYIFATIVQTDTSPVTSQVPQTTYVDNTSMWHHMSDALFQSLYRVLSLLIAILPGILAFFVALAVFTLAGMAISALLRRGLKWIKADERIARERGNVDWSPSSFAQRADCARSPSGPACFWA